MSRILPRRARQALQLRIEERDVEGGVVNDQLGAVDELDQLLDDIGEARLLREELVRDAVDLHARRDRLRDRAADSDGTCGRSCVD